MRRRTLLASVPAIAVAVAGCARPSAQSRAGGENRATDAGAGTVETFRTGRRRVAPAAIGELLDGSPFDLTVWRRKIVVINFWGSWCAPCRAEGADLEATYQATRELGVEFVGVDIRDGRDAAKAFVLNFGSTYPSLFDPAGRIALAFREVPPNVVPATVLLDRRLTVAAVLRKRVNRRELEAAVRALASEETP
jgi:thiol-disulfide isomerase/thioredoxin